jgi:hypothetical protein
MRGHGRAEARHVVIEAVPQEHQDGPDQTFWVYENEWLASTETRARNAMRAARASGTRRRSMCVDVV